MMRTFHVAILMRVRMSGADLRPVLSIGLLDVIGTRREYGLTPDVEPKRSGTPPLVWLFCDIVIGRVSSTPIYSVSLGLGRLGRSSGGQCDL